MSQRYVVDANVLFSAFISGRAFYRLLFSEYTIYLPGSSEKYVVILAKV